MSRANEGAGPDDAWTGAAETPITAEQIQSLATELRAVVATCQALDEPTALALDDYCACVLDLFNSRLLGNENTVVRPGPDGVTFGKLDRNESQEAFESLCIRFRRLWQQKGDSNFAAVRATLRMNIQADPSEESRLARTWIDGLGKTHSLMSKRWAIGELEMTPDQAIRLVFNGELFHRDRGRRKALSDAQGWQWTVVPGIYLQIQIMSRVYRSLAIGVGAVLGTPLLTPVGFDPTFAVFVDAL